MGGPRQRVIEKESRRRAPGGLTKIVNRTANARCSLVTTAIAAFALAWRTRIRYNPDVVGIATADWLRWVLRDHADRFAAYRRLP